MAKELLVLRISRPFAEKAVGNGVMEQCFCMVLIRCRHMIRCSIEAPNKVKTGVYTKLAPCNTTFSIIRTLEAYKRAGS